MTTRLVHRLRCGSGPSVRASAMALALLAAGCDWLGGSADDAPPPAPPPPPASRWTDAAGGRVTGLRADEQAAFDAAVARARAALGDAQVRFVTADAEDRARWAVLWRAVAADGTVEYLWVRPVSWSPHRVEGRLASTPIASAFESMDPGAIVAFPIDEITDWLYERADGTVDGGFTRSALEPAG